jgi:hypothetical protein
VQEPQFFVSVAVLTQALPQVVYEQPQVPVEVWQVFPFV